MWSRRLTSTELCSASALVGSARLLSILCQVRFTLKDRRAAPFTITDGQQSPDGAPQALCNLSKKEVVFRHGYQYPNQRFVARCPVPPCQQPEGSDGQLC